MPPTGGLPGWVRHAASMSRERSGARIREENSTARHSDDMRIRVIPYSKLDRESLVTLGRWEPKDYEMARVPTVGEVLCFMVEDDPDCVDPESMYVVQVRNWIGSEAACHRVEVVVMPLRLADPAWPGVCGILRL